MGFRTAASTANLSRKIGPRILAAYQDALQFERAVSIVIPSVFAVVIFLGVLGNLSVIGVFTTKRRLHTSTNTLIINLALADLLFLIFCVPFTAADYALPVWVFSPGWCACLFYFQSVTAYASVWTLVLMALDRFLAVVYPIKSIMLRNVRNTTVAIVALWLIILLSNVAHLEHFGIYEYIFVIESRQACAFIAMVNGTASESSVLWYFLGFSVFGYFVPLLLTSILYFFLLRSLWSRKPHTLRHSRASLASSNVLPALILGNELPPTRQKLSIASMATNESSRPKRKATWLVTAVILTFAVCWLPLNVAFIQTALAYRRHEIMKGSKGQAIFMIFSQVLAYSNSCANPILYAFMSSNFRKGFSRLVVVLSCKPFWSRFRRRSFLHHDANNDKQGATARPTNKNTNSNNFMPNNNNIMNINNNMNKDDDFARGFSMGFCQYDNVSVNHQNYFSCSSTGNQKLDLDPAFNRESSTIVLVAKSSICTQNSTRKVTLNIDGHTSERDPLRKSVDTKIEFNTYTPELILTDEDVLL